MRGEERTRERVFSTCLGGVNDVVVVVVSPSVVAVALSPMTTEAMFMRMMNWTDR